MLQGVKEMWKLKKFMGMEFQAHLVLMEIYLLIHHWLFQSFSILFMFWYVYLHIPIIIA